MSKNQNFLADFKSAVLFITILPAGKDVPFSPTGMIRFFPVVGLILGLFLALADLAATGLWPPGVAALIDVLVLVAITGAFHLDGLGDAADGIFSHRSRERALEIMKDSRTGMMGLVLIFCVLALKVAGIYSVKSACSPFETLLLLVIVPAYSRGGMLFGIRYLSYGREKTGTGLELFKTRLPLKDFRYLALPVAASLSLGFRGLILNITFGLLIFLILWFYKRKMNCITGDMLGAMTEVTEALIFMVAGIQFL